MTKGVCVAVLVMIATEARGQDFRAALGYLELTHPYGLLVGLPLGDGPFDIEGQVGPGGAGGSLGVAWAFRRQDASDQGIKWFVNAGLGRYFTSANPGTPVGGVLTLIGGLRIVTGGAGQLRFAREGGLTLEAGFGVYQDVDRTVAGESKKGYAGRLAVGWQF
ncbi:MAG TPA: hypothetical protein VN674_00620 [Gemmatimonadales bacterium]|nr:hypothetical protein [Gemmatimonadales bacterium]